jgi:hypothetical protein
MMFRLAMAIVLIDPKSRRHSSSTALKFIRITSLCFFVKQGIELDGKQKAYMKFTSRTLFRQRGNVLDGASRINLKLSENDSTTARKMEEGIGRSNNKDGLRPLSVAEVLNYSSRIWKGQEHVAEMMTSETVRILRKAHEKTPTFFRDKSKKWVLGGLFYLVGRKMNVAKTQKHIARCLDTDEMTIRNSYREWFRRFPEFWSEATVHLEGRYDKKNKPVFLPHSRMDKFLWMKCQNSQRVLSSALLSTFPSKV